MTGSEISKNNIYPIERRGFLGSLLLPTTIAVCSNPASLMPVKQGKASETATAPRARCFSDHRLTSSFLKPCTTLSLMRMGWLWAFFSTAARNGSLIAGESRCIFLHPPQKFFSTLTPFLSLPFLVVLSSLLALQKPTFHGSLRGLNMAAVITCLPSHNIHIRRKWTATCVFRGRCLNLFSRLSLPSVSLFIALIKTAVFLIYNFTKPVHIFYPAFLIEDQTPFW